MRHLLIGLIFILNINLAFAAKIAIIGGGAAGATTALLTQDVHDVTLYEAESNLGGHVKTHAITQGGETAYIDTGTEFFNRPAYPNFLKLLSYLGIAVSTFTLTFNFYHSKRNSYLVVPPIHDGKIEFNSFRPTNLIKMIQLRWVIFHGQSILKKKDFSLTLKSFMDSFSSFIITKDFKNNFLYPLLAAAWGVSVDEIQNFAAFQTLKYLIDGHNAKNKWLEINGGMSQYIEELQKKLDGTHIEFETPVKEINKEGDQYRIVKANGDSDVFDHVVFAVNTRITHDLLKDIDEANTVKAALEKTKTYLSKLDLCQAQAKNLKYKPKNPQVVNVRWDGKETSMTFRKIWKSTMNLPEMLRIWLTHDVRNQHNAESAFDNPITDTFEHPVLDTNYFQAYQIAKKHNGEYGLWYPGIRGDDSHEAAITAAIEVGQRLAPGSKKLNIFS